MFALILVLLMLIAPNTVLASESSFETGLEITYTINPRGGLTVNQEITLTNVTAQKYVTEYHLDITGNFKNITVTDQYDQITPEISQIGQGTRITIPFISPVVGEGKERVFSINYQLDELLEKNGEVWEINLPPLPKVERLTAAKVILLAPYEIGPLAYISPQPASISNSQKQRVYVFENGQIDQKGINAAFGSCQIFDFVLRYHLQNLHQIKGLTQISLPPDTAFQRVYYDHLKPPPSQIFYDADGNLIAQYLLNRNEVLEVQAQGTAVLYSEPLENRPSTDQVTLAKNLLPQPFWEVDDLKINSLASELKNVESIYAYVVKTLSYDESIANSQIRRKGALLSLDQPKKSLCMEFTDLFIALSRASGTPAREAIGFAYTNKTDLKPTQNIIDILHSWPEFWVEEQQLWKPVDPTWENTTLGRDYFNKLDLNHFVFTYHGINSEQPAPAGSYKTGQEIGKDILISFGDYPEPADQLLSISIDFSSKLAKKPIARIEITNPSPTTRYNLPLSIDLKNINLATEFAAPSQITILAPYEKREIDLLLARPRVWETGQAQIGINLDGNLFDYQFRLEQITWPWLLTTTILICLLAGLIYFKLIRKKIPKPVNNLTK